MTQKQNPLLNKLPISPELIKRRIYIIRGREIMLDSDLAELYQVSTKRLNEAVKRNTERFPEDFMFQLNVKEVSLIWQIAMPNPDNSTMPNIWRSQFATSKLKFQNSDKGMRSQFATASKRNIRYLPHAFTEHGIAMMSSVLNSKRAIQMNVFIIRAFIELRKMIYSQQNLHSKISNLENTQKLHGRVLTALVEDIKKIKNPLKTSAIGFKWKN